MSDKVEDILYQAHNEGIWNDVMEVSKSLSTRNFHTYGDKIEEAYNIVKKKKEKGYEDKYLDKKRRGN